MKKTPSTTDLKTALRLVRQTNRPVIITRHGNPAGLLIPMEFYEEVLQLFPQEEEEVLEETSMEYASSLEDPMTEYNSSGE